MSNYSECKEIANLQGEEESRLKLRVIILNWAPQNAKSGITILNWAPLNANGAITILNWAPQNTSSVITSLS